ncbi:calcium-binding protein, partial [Rhizobiaceae sp. 2RAB30]
TSGATNPTGTDSFTYTLVGGDTATVTVTVAGLDSNGDVLLGDSGNNTLNGGVGADQMTGGLGNDKIDGGLGADTMLGGAGNDIYVVDNAGDIVDERATGSNGVDTVQASVHYTLGTGVENLTLTGTVAINGTGNNLANVIVGNAAANTLNGGTGADRLSGGGGNDIYVTDGGDVIYEAAYQGTDTVRSSVSYALGANLENLVLTGASAING